MKSVLPAARQRNYGVDLLRLVSMFYVVLCHCFSQGGILPTLIPDTPEQTMALFVFYLTLCCVNIFGMISGYVGYSEEAKPLRFSTYGMVWLQVVFYSIGITVIFELINSEVATLQDLIRGFTPVTSNLYWYFSAYTGLFFLMPLLNAGIRGCDNRTLKGIFWAIVVLFSLVPASRDVFYMFDGYSFVWVMLLYILGAILKKTEMGASLPGWVLVVGIVFSCTVSTLIGRTWFQREFFSLQLRSLAVQYLMFPTHVLCGICHLLLFVRLRIRGLGQKLIRFAAPGAFAAYILNTHPMVWTYLIEGRFHDLGTMAWPRLLGIPVVFSLGFLVLSVSLDYLRQKLFRLLGLRKLLDRVF